MNPPVPTEKQLKQYGLMMAGVLSFFVAVFFYKAWHTAGMALAVWVLFFLTLALFQRSSIPFQRRPPLDVYRQQERQGQNQCRNGVPHISLGNCPTP